MRSLHESQPAMYGVECKEPCGRSMRQCTQISILIWIGLRGTMAFIVSVMANNWRFVHTIKCGVDQIAARAAAASYRDVTLH